jgi:uncharacterized protein (TIGR01777 family)
MKDQIILAGGSGFIGQSLASPLVAKGYDVVVLTRSPSHQNGAVRYVQWDGKTTGEWMQFVDGARAVVNLTGKSINCRHTPENRREIIDSRIDSVRVLGQAIARCQQPPDAFVQASGIGIYGDAGDRSCDENAPQGDDFLAQVCKLWERAFDDVPASGMRKTILRIAPALAANGGFLKPLALLTRGFLGGHVGSGNQFVSWIHTTDLIGMFLCAIEGADIAGVLNATSPNPVTNSEFMRELRRALHRPWSPPVPKWALSVGSWLLRTEATLALTSCRAIPKHFSDRGFQFEFPELQQALTNIYPTT